MFTTFMNSLAIAISLSTATGVLVHDMRIDKATMAALAAPSAISSYQASTKLVNFSTDSHTHVERTSLNQALQDLRMQSPKIQPRTSEDKKHLMQKNVARGHHAFDNYNLPLA